MCPGKRLARMPAPLGPIATEVGRAFTKNSQRLLGRS